MKFDVGVKTKVCKRCGQEICKRPELCKRNTHFALIEYFGFSPDVVGTEKFYDEYDRVAAKLNEEYHIKMMSTLEMAKQYGMTTQRLDYTFKVLGVKARSYKEALKNYVSKAVGA